MIFEKLYDHEPYNPYGYIKYPENLRRFVDDFHLKYVSWGGPSNMSASDYLSILRDGASVIKEKNGFRCFDEDFFSPDMNRFTPALFDHAAFWEQENGNVISTSMPYGDKDVLRRFYNYMKNCFGYPVEMKMLFLDDRYRFRPNGDYMFVAFFDSPKVIMPGSGLYL